MAANRSTVTIVTEFLLAEILPLYSLPSGIIAVLEKFVFDEHTKISSHLKLAVYL